MVQRLHRLFRRHHADLSSHVARTSADDLAQPGERSELVIGRKSCFRSRPRCSRRDRARCEVWSVVSSHPAGVGHHQEDDERIGPVDRKTIDSDVRVPDGRIRRMSVGHWESVGTDHRHADVRGDRLPARGRGRPGILPERKTKRGDSRLGLSE